MNPELVKIQILYNFLKVQLWMAWRQLKYKLLELNTNYILHDSIKQTTLFQIDGNKHIQNHTFHLMCYKYSSATYFHFRLLSCLRKIINFNIIACCCGDIWKFEWKRLLNYKFGELAGVANRVMCVFNPSMLIVSLT